MQRCLGFGKLHIFCLSTIHTSRKLFVTTLSPLPCSHLLIFFLFVTWVKFIFQENRRGSVEVPTWRTGKLCLVPASLVQNSFFDYQDLFSQDFLDFCTQNRVTVHVNSRITACLIFCPLIPILSLFVLLSFCFSLFCQLPPFLKGGRTFGEVSSQVYENQ